MRFFPAFICMCLLLLPEMAAGQVAVPPGFDDYCRDPASNREIRALLARASAHGLLLKRFENRLGEGMLKRIPCARLLQALRLEYDRQGRAVRLLGAGQKVDREVLDLVTDFISLGLDEPVVTALLAEYRSRKSRLHLARAGDFLARVRPAGWTAGQALPVARIIIRQQLDKERVALALRLLQYGRELRVDKAAIVRTVSGGLAGGASRRRMEQGLEERRPF